MCINRERTLEESVVMAMDGSDTDLISFLPYILQDFWEIGTDPQTMVDLIRKHTRNNSSLKILDLGCGKGAVSVRIAREFKCVCFGMDAIEEFIAEACRKAKEHGVDNLCRFETGDVRENVKDLRGFDAVILGSIGPVFGDYSRTLGTLKQCITDSGIIIIDDGYIEDESDYTHSLMQKKDVVYRQIEDCGMKLIDEIVFDKDYIKDSNDAIFKSLKERCRELIAKFPQKAALFKNYIKKQEEENIVLEKKTVCAVMVVKMP